MCAKLLYEEAQLPADELLRQINSIVTETFSAIGKEWDEKHDIKSIENGNLYHYTKAEVLVKIITQNKLRSTHALFLNDPTELIHAIDITKDIINKASEAMSVKILADVPNEKLENWITRQLSFFVTCFCEDGNLLSQWNRYGAGGDGYSLGFDAKSLSSPEICEPQSELKSRRVLRKVIYKNDEKEEFIRHIVGAIKNAYNRISEIPNALADPHVQERLKYKFLDAVAGYAICFKNEAYKEENEWRLCVNISHGEGNDFLRHMSTQYLQFTDRGGYITPYIEIAPRCKLPIKVIYIGPHVDNINRNSMELLLIKHSIYGVDIRSSTIPSRKLA